MTDYVKINGKRIALTSEMREALFKLSPQVAEAAADPFERTRGSYYCIGFTGDVLRLEDEGGRVDDMAYMAGNYCKDEALMTQRAAHETLCRLLWRFSARNGGLDLDPQAVVYGVYYDLVEKCYGVAPAFDRRVLMPLFKSEELAQRAISEIVEPFMEEHPELVW